MPAAMPIVLAPSPLMSAAGAVIATMETPLKPSKFASIVPPYGAAGKTASHTEHEQHDPSTKSRLDTVERTVRPHVKGKGADRLRAFL